MHPVVVAHAFGRRAGRRRETAFAVPFDEIFDDRARLGEREAIDGHDGRFAERMHRAQLGRREHRARVALIALQLVFDAEFFEHPQHALRAGIVEMMNG